MKEFLDGLEKLIEAQLELWKVMLVIKRENTIQKVVNLKCIKEIKMNRTFYKNVVILSVIYIGLFTYFTQMSLNWSFNTTLVPAWIGTAALATFQITLMYVAIGLSKRKEGMNNPKRLIKRKIQPKQKR